MNSRERVLLAINHQEADRAPIDVGATRQSGIAASVYHLLKRRLGLSTPTRVYDVYQMLAEIEQPILERFGADCVGLNRPSVAFGIRNEGWKPWTLQDGTPVEVPGGFDPRTDHLGNLVLYDARGAAIAKMPKGGFYFDRLEKFPGAAHADPAGLKIPLLSAEECDHFHAQSEAAWQNTDKAIITAMGPPLRAIFRTGHRRLFQLDDDLGLRAGLCQVALRATRGRLAGESPPFYGGGGRPGSDSPVQR